MGANFLFGQPGQSPSAPKPPGDPLSSLQSAMPQLPSRQAPQAGGMDLSQFSQQQPALRSQMLPYMLGDIVSGIAGSQHLSETDRMALTMAIARAQGVDPSIALYGMTPNAYSSPTAFTQAQAGLPVQPIAPGAAPAAATSRPAAQQPVAQSGNQPASEPDATSHASFVQSLLPTAQAWEAKTGIPASMWIAWAASESNWGAAGNALFGVKGSGTAGSLSSPTWEMVNGQRVNTTDSFATYNNPDEAFQGAWEFLQQPRYQDAVNYLGQTRDATGFLQRVNAAGYATNPDWWQSILDIASTSIDPLMK